MTHWPVGSPGHLLPHAHNVPLNSDSVSKRITMKMEVALIATTKGILLLPKWSLLPGRSHRLLYHCHRSAQTFPFQGTG